MTFRHIILLTTALSMPLFTGTMLETAPAQKNNTQKHLSAELSPEAIIIAPDPLDETSTAFIAKQDDFHFWLIRNKKSAHNDHFFVRHWPKPRRRDNIFDCYEGDKLTLKNFPRLRCIKKALIRKAFKHFVSPLGHRTPHIDRFTLTSRTSHISRHNFCDLVIKMAESTCSEKKEKRKYCERRHDWRLFIYYKKQRLEKLRKKHAGSPTETDRRIVLEIEEAIKNFDAEKNRETV